MDDEDVVLQSADRQADRQLERQTVIDSSSVIDPDHNPGPGSRFVPQGNRLDLVELNLPLEDLLDLTFIRTLLHLLSTNQVQELRGQDEVPFYSLWIRGDQQVSPDR